jgi:hypothetical protein
MIDYRALLVWLSGFLAVFLAPGRAESAPPERPLYTIAVGHNAVADVLKRSGDGLVTLRYADDDALKFYSLMERASRRAFLLSVLDADTQRRFPEVARRAAPPSIVELERVVTLVSESMRRDRALGAEPELVFFFSGHGVRDESGNASLSLLDGALTRAWLYERLFARVPARLIHVVIDACHAEALVRPRDVNAQVEPLDTATQAAYVDSATLERFPNVGALLASSAQAQSFEWDAYRGGVFAHQLLSGLRGGADVNGDGSVEYSEIAAFLSAANLGVKDPRARLDVVVKPPRMDRRAPLLELSRLGRQVELRGRATGPWARGFFVETERGERLVDLLPENASPVSLRLPVGERLFLVRTDGEIKLAPSDGGIVELESLVGRSPEVRARGSLDSALRQGLFTARFGPAFYQGYVSQRDDLVPVPFGEAMENRDNGTESQGSSTRAAIGTGLLVGGAVAAVAAATFTGLAVDARNDYEGTDLERSASEAKDRFNRYRTLAYATGGAALAMGGTGLLLIALPDERRPESALAIDGIMVGAVGSF